MTLKPTKTPILLNSSFLKSCINGRQSLPKLSEADKEHLQFLEKLHTVLPCPERSLHQLGGLDVSTGDKNLSWEEQGESWRVVDENLIPDEEEAEPDEEPTFALLHIKRYDHVSKRTIYLDSANRDGTFRDLLLDMKRDDERMGDLSIWQLSDVDGDAGGVECLFKLHIDSEIDWQYGGSVVCLCHRGVSIGELLTMPSHPQVKCTVQSYVEDEMYRLLNERSFLSKLFSIEAFSDVTLVCEANDEETEPQISSSIRAHRLVLAQAPYFFTLFTLPEGFPESHQKLPIHVNMSPEYSHQVVSLLVGLMYERYSDLADASARTLCDMYRLADYWGVTQFMPIIELFLCRKLKSNLC
ncbi:hypothetical protein HK102_008269 [Quaeritorhiza haematococci]|nr:hypothetical protein HK102_008269 [Quaeritorhiza haematococci]